MKLSARDKSELEALRQDFEKWRKKKKYVRERTPTDLANRAIALGERTSVGIVEQATGVSRRCFGKKAPRVRSCEGVVRVAPVKIDKLSHGANEDQSKGHFAEVVTPRGTLFKLFQPLSGADFGELLLKLEERQA